MTNTLALFTLVMTALSASAALPVPPHQHDPAESLMALFRDSVRRARALIRAQVTFKPGSAAPQAANNAAADLLSTPQEERVDGPF